MGRQHSQVAEGHLVDRSVPHRLCEWSGQLYHVGLPEPGRGDLWSDSAEHDAGDGAEHDPRRGQAVLRQAVRHIRPPGVLDHLGLVLPHRADHHRVCTRDQHSRRRLRLLRAGQLRRLVCREPDPCRPRHAALAGLRVQRHDLPLHHQLWRVGQDHGRAHTGPLALGRGHVLHPLPGHHRAIIYMLVIQQRQLARHRPNRPYPGLSLVQAVRAFLIDFDVIGLLCMAGGFCLLLLPLTIADRAPHGWSTGYIIAMFVLGGVLLVAWPFVELRVSRPLVRFKYLFGNVDVITATAVYFLDQFSYGMTLSSQYQWCQIVFGYTFSGATYFTYTQSLTLVIFGVIAIYTRRYKWMIVFGAAFCFLGVGLKIRYREADSSTFQVVIPQVIQGIGGGFMSANLFVAAQAGTAGVTGFMFLTLSLGSAISSAVTGAVQQGLLGLLHKVIDSIAGDTTTAVTIYDYGSTIMSKYPLGTPIRTATISAWNEVMHRLLIGSIVLAAINLLVSFFVPDRELAHDSQNNVQLEPLVPLPPLSMARELDED